MKHAPAFAGLAALLLSLVAGCGGSGGGQEPITPPPPPDDNVVPTPTSKLTLNKFSGPQACDAYESYVAGSFTEQFLTPIRCLAIDGPCPIFLGVPEPAGAPAEGDTAGGFSPLPDRVSQTNTQEQGVDEADIVKADAAGNLYILTGRKLVIVDAFPPAGLATTPQAILDLGGADPNFYASDFFLDEAAGRAVVLGSTLGFGMGEAVAVIVNVADPTAPAEVTRVGVDGYPLQVRRVGNRVHRVSRFDVSLPPSIYDNADLIADREDYFRAENEGRSADAAQIKASIRSAIGALVAQAGAEAYLPRLRTGSSATPLACTDIAAPDVQTGMGLAVFDSFSTGGGEHAGSAAINNGYLVYASENSLYLAQSSLGWFFAPDQADETAIYRFALSASGAPAYQGLGRVTGSVIGSYALSEFGGNLRVASTETQFRSGNVNTVNRVTVLQAAGAEMAKLGELSGFGEPGEYIRGVRFVGDRGFVVTFRQIDPLFAIDLSNPAAPRVASDLKIPGFSSHLQPLGSDYLLTIGRGGEDEQLTGAVAIQLYDVRNLAAIAKLAEIQPTSGASGASYSTGEYDPHAFTYFPDSAAAAVPGTLAVPLQAYDFNNGGGFSGFLVVRVDPSAPAPLTELARLDHTSLAQQNECNGGTPPPTFTEPASDSPPPCFDYIYAAEPRRSVFMESGGDLLLYTISMVGVLANDARNPAVELGRTTLPYDQPFCCFVEPGFGFIDGG